MRKEQHGVSLALLIFKLNSAVNRQEPFQRERLLLESIIYSCTLNFDGELFGALLFPCPALLPAPLPLPVP